MEVLYDRSAAMLQQVFNLQGALIYTFFHLWWQSQVRPSSKLSNPLPLKVQIYLYCMRTDAPHTIIDPPDPRARPVF